MKQKLFLIPVFLLIFGVFVFGQQQKADSILLLIQNSKNIKRKTENFNILGNTYRYFNTDSAYKYILHAKQLAGQHNIPIQLAEACNELGIIFYSRKELDSAYFYLQKGYKIATANKDYQGLLKSLNSKGLYKYREKKYNEAFVAFNEALGYTDKVGNKKLLAMLYNNLAILYKATGNAELALEYYHLALVISEESNDSKGIGILTSNIGLLYQTQDKIDLALNYLNRSLAIRIQNGNKKGESYVHTNLGVVYENLEEYDKALASYKKALGIKKDINHKSGIAVLYNNMGIIYKKKAMYDSAHYYCSKSLVLRKELKDQLGEARTRTNIGQLYLLQNDFEASKKELDRALELAADYKNFTVLQKVYAALYQVSSARKQYKEALSFLLKSTAFKDSIFNLEKEKSIASIEAKYNNLKKEKENVLLARENRIKDGKIKRQILIGVGLLVLVFLFVLLSIFAYRSKNKISNKNKEIEEQSKQLKVAYQKLQQLSDFKETMTNMLVHDLKNPLHVILNARQLKNMPDIDEIIQQSGYTMQNLVLNILDVYKYQQTKIELSLKRISIQKVMQTAIDELAYLIKEKCLRIEFKYDFDTILKADEDLLRRVFVNLFSNAIRFTPKNESIVIKMGIEGCKTLRVGIFNPGPGIAREKQQVIFEYFKQADKQIQEKMRSSGLGLTFCKMAVEAHQGTIGVLSDNKTGVEFWVTLPNVIDTPEINKEELFHPVELISSIK